MRCCAKADSAIHQINHYPTDKYLGNQLRYAVDLTIIPRARMGSESIAHEAITYSLVVAQPIRTQH